MRSHKLSGSSGPMGRSSTIELSITLKTLKALIPAISPVPPL
jgi:hypothetical protein